MVFRGQWKSLSLPLFGNVLRDFQRSLLLYTSESSLLTSFAAVHNKPTDRCIGAETCRSSWSCEDCAAGRALGGRESRTRAWLDGRRRTPSPTAAAVRLLQPSLPPHPAPRSPWQPPDTRQPALSRTRRRRRHYRPAGRRCPSGLSRK